MESKFKDLTMEEIYNSLLEVFDEHKVSPEDGALLSTNLLLNSLAFLKEEGLVDEEGLEEEITNIKKEILDKKGLVDEEGLFDILDKILKMSSTGLPAISPIRPTNRPYFLIGLNRTWGLDPSLLDEEN